MMIRKLFNLDFAAIFFATAYSFLINYASSFRSMGHSSTADILQWVSYGFIALVAIIFIRKTFNLKFRTKLRMVVFLLLLGSFVALNILSGQSTMAGSILGVLIGITVVDIRDRTIVKYLFVSLLGFFALSTILGLTGVSTGGNIIDTPLLGDKSDSVELFAFGLRNPNVASRFFIPIVLCAMYLYGRKPAAVLLIILASLAVGYTTGSTMGMFVMLLSVLVFISLKKVPVKKFIRKLAPHSFAINTIIVFILAITFGYQATLPNEVNTALTGRPWSYGLRIENGLHLNLMGNNDTYYLEKGGWDDAPALDNMPLYTMVFYGLIVFGMYLFLYYKSGKIIKDDMILAMGILLMIVMLTEKNGLFVDNIYIIFAVKYVFNWYFNKRSLYEKN